MNSNNYSKDARPLMVSIRCITYNHEPYIRQCLEGFVMQKTNFRFEAIVHDDASTDGTAAIIQEYAEKYPDIIKPIYETENQYSKHDSSLTRIMDEACKGKYIAWCEGDDYWTDPQKLQIQVDFMENHPDCSMVCNRTKRFSQENGIFKNDIICAEKDCYLKAQDIIDKGGMYIGTCSIVYRKKIMENLPDYHLKCHVADYPLQIRCAMMGKVWYIDKVMSVYRIDVFVSWTNRNINTSKLKLFRNYYTEVEMLEGYARDYFSFSKEIIHHRNLLIMWLAPYKGNIAEYNCYLSVYGTKINTFGFIDRCRFFVMKSDSIIARLLRKNSKIRNIINGS